MRDWVEGISVEPRGMEFTDRLIFDMLVSIIWALVVRIGFSLYTIKINIHSQFPHQHHFLPTCDNDERG